MKYIIIILCFGLVRIANGQWLETTIYLPDGFGSMGSPGCLAYNSTNNTVYTGGGGGYVFVIDGETNQRIARILAGENIHDLVWNSTNNKIYSANYSSDNVTIIDGATNSVITTVPVGDNPHALVWNSTNNKVYCANLVSDDITIIDGATNSASTTVTVGDYPRALAWNSINNRTYVANYDNNSISVIRDQVGIEEIAGNQSLMTRLAQNFPNPFTKVTSIRYQIAGTGSQEQQVTLKVYDITGRLVRTLVDADKESGNHMAVWDGRDDRREKVTSGVYFYRLNTNGFTVGRNLILIKK